MPDITPDDLNELEKLLGPAPREPTKLPEPPRSNKPPLACYIDGTGELKDIECHFFRGIYTDHTYSGSEKRLLADGWHRHLSPREEFSILCDGTDGKLPVGMRGVYQDMLCGSNPGEWLNVAFGRTKNTLRIYTLSGDKRLRWHLRFFASTYDGIDALANGPLSPEWDIECDVSCFPSGKPIPLREFSPELTYYLWGRSFAEIPYALRSAQQLNIYLPPEGTIWPAMRGNETLGEKYSIIAGPVVTSSGKRTGTLALSRGLRG